ncbi:UDP-N-acetylmuramate--L-alanine ligase [Halanaerobium saccharolyticum]|uniref:UDP-N-acetylmuramate--L-alanine ligase n=1 Tax=Halanaerobium saccharolyticum TaxID=43595 RepID=A0A4R7YWW4_9FIRM|nr:UDP-N-acetylmuramate--L-alanine ligase [Halanaerobium saccharolyticum]TDW02370.1 UDP-N-acetylmuramate--L-alanine ligase [Halanaerobium saccharolyticum]TDX59090.1 UDP-N-acetylmuramate--L-alanine ligase [Halanaerobium saccharolyticum]
MLNKNSHIHLIGIGGVSMSGIAEILAERGYKVSGSDLNESKYLDLLRKYQVKLFIGHAASNIDGADLIVKTSAIPDNNPEIQAARKKGLKIVKRAEMLSYLMRDKKTIAVAGTHGKTTVTAMLAAIFKKAQKDPAVMVGGFLKELNGNMADGAGKYFITEADESDGSFLYFNPDLLLLNNLELDHPDYYQNLDEFMKIFKRFADKNDKQAFLLYNKDDKNLDSIFLNRNKCSSFSLKKGKFTAKNIEYNNFNSCFDFYDSEEFAASIELSVPGEYNLYNALAAAAAARHLEIDIEAIKTALKEFSGVGRRFDFKGKVLNSAVDIVDDYAHHPTEIKELLKTVKNMDYNKIRVVFQPHRYSRTHKFLEEFSHSFINADQVYLTDIFSASEKMNYDISLTDFAEEIAKKSEVECCYLDDFNKIAARLLAEAEAGDIILTVGAGDITELPDLILKGY